MPPSATGFDLLKSLPSAAFDPARNLLSLSLRELQPAGRTPGRSSPGEEIGLQKGESPSLIAHLAIDFMAALHRLFRLGGLRRDHVHVRQGLGGRVRGHVELSGWLRNFASGRPELIP